MSALFGKTKKEKEKEKAKKKPNLELEEVTPEKVEENKL